MQRKIIHILVSPAHYIYDLSSQSEYYFISRLLYDLAEMNKDIVFHVVCGKHIKSNVEMPNNLHIYSLFMSPNSFVLTIWKRMSFYIFLVPISVKIMRKYNIEYIWHLFPNGIVSFNPVIFLKLEKFFSCNKKVKKIIGRLQPWTVTPGRMVAENSSLVDLGYSRLELFFWIILKRVAGIFSKYYFSCFDKFIFTHKSAVYYYEKKLNRKFDKFEYSIIPNGIDHKNFKYYPKKYKSPFKFLFVGNLTKNKNVKLIINVCAELVKLKFDFKLMIVGDGKEKKYLQLLVNNLKLQDHISFCGKVPKKRISKYFDVAHFLFLLSKKESLPNVILEAWASGTMVICSELKSLKELIGTQYGKTFDIEKIEARMIADYIINISKDDYCVIVKNSYKESIKFSWKNVIQKYQDIIRK